MSRFRSFVVSSSVVAACVVGLVGGVTAASAASTLPTLDIALNGTTGVSVSGSEVSGAVNVVSTFTGTAPSGPNANGPTWGLVRLNPGVTVAQAVAAVQTAHGDINALTPYGSLFADDSAAGPAQTVLTPGNWVALTDRERKPGIGAVHRHPVLVARRAAERGCDPDGHRVWLPRADEFCTTAQCARPEWRLPGAHGHRDRRQERHHRAAGHGAAARRQGRKGDEAGQPAVPGLAGPISPGGMQQAVLNAKPGYYVEACFMDTQDGREHTQLGMMRPIRVVK